MAVIKVEKTEGFTVMSNCHLRDSRLSLKAIGLLSKMLSLPENWDYTVAGLVAICKEGRSAISESLRELESAGYVTRNRTHSERGHFDGIEYIVREKPSEVEPLSENLTMVEDGEFNQPLSDFPPADNPSADNPKEINKDLNNNLDNIIPPIIPQKRKGRDRKSTPVHEPERFEKFWECYPRHEGRQKAAAAWDKLHADPGLLDRMARSLLLYLKCPDWERGCIPHASTWLNQRRFEEVPFMGVKQPPAYHASGGWAPDEERY